MERKYAQFTKNENAEYALSVDEKLSLLGNFLNVDGQLLVSHILVATGTTSFSKPSERIW